MKPCEIYLDHDDIGYEAFLCQRSQSDHIQYYTREKFFKT